MNKTLKKKVWTRRGRRTTTVQLVAFLEFLELNPDFVDANPFHKEQNKFIAIKWQELACKLNSIKGPTKTTHDWKVSLIHWKNQLKSRTRKIRESIAINNGSAEPQINLSPLEVRALSIFGDITIDNREINTGTEEDELEVVTCPIKNEPELNLNDNVDSEQQATASQKRAWSSLPEPVSDKSYLNENREEFDKRIIEERIAIERKNSDSIGKIADAVSKMADALLIFAKAYTNNN